MNKKIIIFSAGGLLFILLVVLILKSKKKTTVVVPPVLFGSPVSKGITLTAPPATTSTAAQDVITNNAATVRLPLDTGNINSKPINKSAVGVSTDSVTIYTAAPQLITLNATDLVNAITVLMVNLPLNNTQYQSYKNSYLGIITTTGGTTQPNITVTFNAVANQLYLDLAKFYVNNCTGMIGGMGNVTNQLSLQNNLKGLLLPTNTNGYSHTAFAYGITSLYNACIQELINEATAQVDPLIYNPYANYVAAQAAQPHTVIPASGLQTTWEVVKWQITTANNMPQPCILYTYSSSLFGSDNKGAYFSNGSNIQGLTNSSGNKYYKCNTAQLAQAALQAFLVNWKTQQAYITAQAQVSNFAHAIGFLTFCVNAIDGNYLGVATYIVSQ